VKLLLTVALCATLLLFATILSLTITIPVKVKAANISIEQRQQYDIDKHCTIHTNQVPNMEQILTYFNCGHVTFFNNGTTLRNYTIIIEENHKLPISLAEDTKKPIMFPAWTFNSSIPGPTLRMTKGDHILITVKNKGTMPHSFHMHSIHPGNMDGVPIVSGESGFIAPGHKFTYDFIAGPAGIFPYHCHMQPVAEHLNRGLYGALIIDPPLSQARSPAQEIVMFLNGYDLNIKAPEFPRMPTFTEANQMMAGNETIFDTINNEHDNALYSVNGIANYYMHHPIPIKLHEPLRIFMFNLLDFEENSFHLHGAVYQYYPSGTAKTPAFTSDMVVLGQGDRGILETEFNYPGLYMSHAHFDQVGTRGWSSLFSVK
jgi:FtsP/CotA-like multicopper oxidase with cupredoxin domain